jgi:hypothetical protein
VFAETIAVEDHERETVYSPPPLAVHPLGRGEEWRHELAELAPPTWEYREAFLGTPSLGKPAARIVAALNELGPSQRQNQRPKC